MDNFELQVYSLTGYALQRRGFEVNPKSGKTDPENAARLWAAEGGRTRPSYKSLSHALIRAAVMQDMKAHLTGLTVKARACRKIATRAADPDECADYNRQADQFERMAEAVRFVIAAQRKTASNTEGSGKRSKVQASSGLKLERP